MEILESLRKRINDFRKLLALDEPEDESEEAFEIDGITYQNFTDWLCTYTGHSIPFCNDNLYRAERLDLTQDGMIEYFLFFNRLERIDYVYGNEQMTLSNYSLTPEYNALYLFYYRFLHYIN